MIYDCKKDGGNWYYLGASDDGSMKTGWCYDKTSCKWYYFNADGVMQTEWIELDSKWYYLNASGAMCTGWIVVDSKDYCLYSDGAMIFNTTAYGYSFASNGVATKIQ